MKRLNQSGKVGMAIVLMISLIGIGVGLTTMSAKAQVNAYVRNMIAVVPTGTITPGTVYWVPEIGSPSGSVSVTLPSAVQTAIVAQATAVAAQATAQGTPKSVQAAQATVVSAQATVVSAVATVQANPTPGFSVKTFSQSWAPNGPGWLGISPVDKITPVADSTFNANSTPVVQSQATPSQYTDYFFNVQNTGIAPGNAIAYIGSASTSWYLAPAGGNVQHIFLYDALGNVPVSFGGDATAGVTIRFGNVNKRIRP